MADVQSRFTSAPNFDVPTFRTVLDFDSAAAAGVAHREVGIQVDSEVQPVASRPFGAADNSSVQYHFYAAHHCMFSPGAIWTVDDTHNKGWYVQGYQVQTELLDDAGQPVTDAFLVSSVPETKSGTQSYSSSLNQSISGNLGFMGDAPMAGLAGSVSWSDSHSFDVTDVTMTNSSDQPGHNPGSDILMEMRDSVGHLGGFPTYYFDLDYPAPLATKSFQPVVLELWRLPRRAGGSFRLQMTVTCKLAFMRVTSADTKSWVRDWQSLQSVHVIECPYPQPPL